MEGGGSTKKPSVGGGWIFSGTTHGYIWLLPLLLLGIQGRVLITQSTTRSTSWSTSINILIDTCLTCDLHLDQQSVNSRRTVNWLIHTNWKLVTQLSTNCGPRCQWSHRWSVNRASIKCQLSSIEWRVTLDRRHLLVLMIHFISNIIYILKQASHFSFVIVNKVFVLLSETGYLVVCNFRVLSRVTDFSLFFRLINTRPWNTHIVNFTGWHAGSLFGFCVWE